MMLAQASHRELRHYWPARPQSPPHSRVAPVGTDAMMLVALQLVGVAGIPLNVTVLVPCVAPKFVPVIVTGAHRTCRRLSW